MEQIDLALKAGALSRALELAKAEVREDASNANLRYLLFEIFSFQGDFDRAGKQLKIAGELDKKNYEFLDKVYSVLLELEQERERVFAAEQSPLIMGEPDKWVIELIQALKADSEGKLELGQKIREEALAKADSLPGTVNGTEIPWLCDFDSRLGPIIEAYVEGKYYWIPAKQIKSIEVEPASHLVDKMWFPVKIHFHNEGETAAYLPGLYSQSYKSADEQVQLGQKTEWEGDLVKGQKMYFAEDLDWAVLDLRSVVFEG